jgi:small conductance mechanosensitive channel
MDLTNVAQATVLLIAAFGLKVLGALVLWLIARRVVAYLASLVVRSLKYPFDQTVAGYIGTAIAVLLNIGVILGILGLFGIETTSFAALLAGVGVAIGAAWGGLLANLAAGIFLLILRPFKIGDFIQAAGIIGTVQEVGLFVTTVDTMDNVRTFVGNNKLLSDHIQNFTANPYRRVDLVAQLHNVVDPRAAIHLLKASLARIPNVLTEPAPDVEILSFTPLGPVLAVRPYCHNDHYWQVYFDTNRAIRESFGDAGFPAPEQNVFVRNAGSAAGTPRGLA